MELFKVVCLALSLANLSGLALGLFYKDGTDEPAVSLRVGRRTRAILLLAVSQILYLADMAAWSLQWSRSYPGAPLPFASGILGLALCAAGLLAAVSAQKPQRYIGLSVGVTLTFLWLVGLAVSVAV